MRLRGSIEFKLPQKRRKLNARIAAKEQELRAQIAAKEQEHKVQIVTKEREYSTLVVEKEHEYSARVIAMEQENKIHSNKKELELNEILIKKEQENQSLRLQIINRTLELQNTNQALNEILISKVWKVALFLRKLRLILLPLGSWRERSVRAIYHSLNLGVQESCAHCTVNRARFLLKTRLKTIWQLFHPT